MIYFLLLCFFFDSIKSLVKNICFIIKRDPYQNLSSIVQLALSSL